MANNKQQLKDLHDSRNGKLVLGAVALFAAWLMFLRASDTGSLQQYGLMLLLIGVGFNRLISAVKGSKQV